MKYKQTILTPVLGEHIISHPELYHICGSDKELPLTIPIANSARAEVIVNIPATSKWYDLLDTYFQWTPEQEQEWQEFLGFKELELCDI